jgi:hypothetical protein
MAQPAEAYATTHTKVQFAGFIGAIGGGPSSATATITLPTVTCLKPKTEVDFGVGQFQPPIGSLFFGSVPVEAAVVVRCLRVPHDPNLVTSWSGYVATQGGSPVLTGSVTPKPGDTITLSVTSGSNPSATVNDVTSGQTLSSSISVTNGGSEVFVGAGGNPLAGSIFLPHHRGLPKLSNFGFTNVNVNSNPFSSLGSLIQQSYVISPRVATLTTGPLTNGGTAFTETYAPPAL